LKLIFKEKSMRYKKLVLTLVLLIILVCCKKSTIPSADEIGQVVDHIVTMEQAKTIAKRNSRSDNLSRRLVDRQIRDIKAIASDGQNPSFYVINYIDSGFVIVAGDDRLMPVLAFSNSNPFPVEENQVYPNGLVKWMANVADTINDIRARNAKQDTVLKIVWSNLSTLATENISSRANDPVSTMGLITTPLPIPTAAGQQATQVITMEPVLSTTWGQGIGYNDALPNMGCPLYSNGKPPTGCIATCTAQIMKFHEWPASFNWAAMPLNYGSGTTAALMSHIGSSVGMDYDCNGSSAYTQDAATALRNIYNYKSAAYGNYNHIVASDELFAGYPIILAGGRKDKWLFFNVYADGHAWVADGVQKINIMRSVSYIPVDDVLGYKWQLYASYLYFHMNWGWPASSGNYNGFYGFDNFNPGENTFNYNTAMITNIRPNR